MLPLAYRTPGAVVLIAGGLLATFAGYRLFRIVLGIYGFILGAIVASSIVGGEQTGYLVGAALVGGIIGALILIGAYFVGVALLGAGLGALGVNVIWSQLDRDPHAIIVIAAAILGALGALAMQRYVIIISTAFGGAGTVIAGALELAGDGSAAGAVERGDVWAIYLHMHPAPASRWVVVAWLLLGAIGVAVQIIYSPKEKTA
jgi:hypothetical protein